MFRGPALTSLLFRPESLYSCQKSIVINLVGFQVMIIWKMVMENTLKNWATWMKCTQRGNMKPACKERRKVKQGEERAVHFATEVREDKLEDVHMPSATNLVSIRNTWVFLAALTALMEPRIFGRRIKRDPSPRRRVALHTEPCGGY